MMLCRKVLPRFLIVADFAVAGQAYLGLNEREGTKKRIEWNFTLIDLVADFLLSILPFESIGRAE